MKDEDLESMRATQATFHNWPQLPPELQLNALSHILNFEGEIFKSLHKAVLEQRLLPLVATQNQHLAEIAQEVYCKSNRFSFRIGNRFGPLIKVARLKAPVAATIRHLHIHAYGCVYGDTLEDILLSRYQTWRWLLKVRQPLIAPQRYIPWTTMATTPDAEKDTAWQTTFTNLLNLKIYWDVLNRAEIWPILETIDKQLVDDGCCVETAELNRLKNSTGKLDILLRARKVEFIVRIDLGYEFGAEVCESHSDVFEDLKVMATENS
ncbi:hypothetical protein EJ02DRAFT_24066 [Clathrospora elynae]|uniref:Uncharacterized protein n=1 Tax=Clathrospora elynae TaxID=706981 RepID=A0A6A5SZC2_9PLEO|nr:hypothetical protein EJ02DRAFT_24066 [Clathrospora elynae]